MLSIVWLSQLACKKTIWSGFDPRSQTWVVSDLKSKIFLTGSLLKNYEILAAEPVKRASELWREILRANDPSIQVLSPLGTTVLAREFLNREGWPEWCARPNAPRKLVKACQNLAQLITHPLAKETL